jgi:hypothetical protein
MSAAFSLAETGDADQYWECDSLNVMIEGDFTDPKVFTKQPTRSGYVVWSNNNYEYSLWYKPDYVETRSRCCWVGKSGGDGFWGYSEANTFDNGDYRFSRSSSPIRRVTMTCGSKANVNNDKEEENTGIAGIQKPVFIVGVVLLALFFIVLVVGCFMWRRKQPKPDTSFQYSPQRVQSHSASGSRVQVSSNMLFGDPHDPNWQKDVDQAVMKVQGEDSDEEIDAGEVKFLAGAEATTPQESQKLRSSDLFPTETNY